MAALNMPLPHRPSVSTATAATPPPPPPGEAGRGTLEAAQISGRRPECAPTVHIPTILVHFWVPACQPGSPPQGTLRVLLPPYSSLPPTLVDL